MKTFLSSWALFKAVWGDLELSWPSHAVVLWHSAVLQEAASRIFKWWATEFWPDSAVLSYVQTKRWACVHIAAVSCVDAWMCGVLMRLQKECSADTWRYAYNLEDMPLKDHILQQVHLCEMCRMGTQRKKRACWLHRTERVRRHFRVQSFFLC